MQQLLTIKQVMAQVSISKSGLYRRMKDAGFPRPQSIGPRAVRWRADEVAAWVESRPRSQGWAGLEANAVSRPSLHNGPASVE